MTDADARGSEPIRGNGDELVGRAHHRAAMAGASDKSLALGMVRPELGEIGTELEIQILGKPHRATVIAEAPTIRRTSGCGRKDAGLTSPACGRGRTPEPSGEDG